MFHHAQTESKENARQIVEQFAGNPKSILSLSADNFLFERKFPQARIVSCELDPVVYKRGLKNKPNNVVYLNDNIFNLEPDYDFIWLDFCANMYPTLINEVISFMQKAIQYRPTISITFYLKQEISFSKFLYVYGAKTLDDFRFKVFPELIKLHTGYEVVDIYKYLSVGNSPMGVFTFKPIKTY